MSCPLLPLEGRVIVIDEPVDSKTRGGLFMPDRAKAAPTWGEVVAIGPLWDREGQAKEPPVEIGDRVLFGEFCGGEVEVDEQKYRILGLGEVAAVDARVRDLHRHAVVA